MKVIEFVSNTKLNGCIEIIPLSDIHLGDAHCNLQLLKETIDYIADNKDTYCILNGDLINNATKNSVSDVYNETLTPLAQIQYAITLFKPIKNKIISVVSGNHEDRTWRESGVDLTAVFCQELGILDKYSNEGNYIFLTCGAKRKPRTNRNGKVDVNVFGIYHTHGAGGGKRVGSKMNAVEDMASVVDADIYIHSHTHQIGAFKNDYFRTDFRSKNVQSCTKTFINTNAFLRFGGYGEKAKFKPSTMSVPKIKLLGGWKGKDVKVEI